MFFIILVLAMLSINQLLSHRRIDKTYRFKPFYTQRDGGDDINRRKLIDKLRGQARENT